VKSDPWWQGSHFAMLSSWHNPDARRPQSKCPQWRRIQYPEQYIQRVKPWRSSSRSRCLTLVVITSLTFNIAQTALIRSVVDLLYSLLYNKSTTNRISGVWTYKLTLVVYTRYRQTDGCTTTKAFTHFNRINAILAGGHPRESVKMRHCPLASENLTNNQP